MSSATRDRAYLDTVHRYPIDQLSDPRQGFIRPLCYHEGQREHLRDHVVNGFAWPSAPRCPGCFGGSDVD